MLDKHHSSTRAKPEAEKRFALFWLAIATAVAAAILIACTFNFHGLDRLLPDGEPFAPYYTT